MKDKFIDTSLCFVVSSTLSFYGQAIIQTIITTFICLLIKEVFYFAYRNLMKKNKNKLGSGNINKEECDSR